MDETKPVHSTELENIEHVIAYAKALPDFPNKALVVQRLETRNLNRYQEARMNLNEVLAADGAPQADACGVAVTREQLQTLIDRISLLEAQDIFAE